MKFERTNKLYVVGELIEVNKRQDKDREGNDYIAGDIKVLVKKEKDGDNVVSLSFFAKRLTKEKKENPRYKNYQSLEGFLNKRVKISGEVQGRAFFSSAQGQVITFNELSAGFVNQALDTDASAATFEFSGFVNKGLVERRNKEDKVYSYDLEVGQADFSGERLNLVRFNIDPESRNIVAAVQSQYTKGSTISFVGEVEFKSTIETRTEEVAFGDPIVKTFTNVIKRYLITGGKETIMGETAYSADKIAQLESAYKDYLLEIEAAAKNSAQSGSARATEPAKNSVNSLI